MSNETRGAPKTPIEKLNEWRDALWRRQQDAKSLLDMAEQDVRTHRATALRLRDSMEQAANAIKTLGGTVKPIVGLDVAAPTPDPNKMQPTFATGVLHENDCGIYTTPPADCTCGALGNFNR